MRPDFLIFPVRLVDKLASLAVWVSTLDSAPTEQSYQLAESLISELRVQVEGLESGLENELARFNQQLRNQGLRPIM